MRTKHKTQRIFFLFRGRPRHPLHLKTINPIVQIATIKKESKKNAVGLRVLRRSVRAHGYENLGLRARVEFLNETKKRND